jgi:hypothetical protein
MYAAVVLALQRRVEKSPLLLADDLVNDTRADHGVT